MERLGTFSLLRRLIARQMPRADSAAASRKRFDGAGYRGTRRAIVAVTGLSNRCLPTRKEPRNQLDAVARMTNATVIATGMGLSDL
jgi:hypothetical protein